MKKLIIFLLLAMPIISFGQNDTIYIPRKLNRIENYVFIAPDTILYVKKVSIMNTLINKKTGRIVKKWIKRKKVKSGFIVNLYGNVWEVNGKLMYSDNNKDYSFVK